MEIKQTDQDNLQNGSEKVKIYTISDLFPEYYGIAAQVRLPSKPLDITILPPNSKDKPGYTNVFIAKYLDGEGNETDLLKKARFRFADPDLATIMIANGFKPRNQAQFDTVYCPQEAFREGLSSLPHDRIFPSGEYKLPYSFYLEPKHNLTIVLDKIYGANNWRLVPIANDDEQTKRPGVNDENLGFFTRCALFFKQK